MLGGLHAQMYVRSQAITHPPKLHISKVIEIKVVAAKECPRLPIWDVAKKKGFKLYYNEEMPSRKMKAEVMNNSSY